MENKWYENFINDLEYGGYVFILNTFRGVQSALYMINGKEYSVANMELFNRKNGNISPYEKYESIFMDMMNNDKALHVYRYENGLFAEHKCLSEKRYDSFVYGDCTYDVLLKEEFCLEPKGDAAKSKFQKSFQKAERFKKTLLYACYVNDTQAIVERAKTASKAQLDKKFEYLGTPLSFCAKNDNLEGFKALVEAGSDMNKSITGGTVSPLDEAVKHSPDIIFYVHDNFHDIFEAHFKDWSGCISYCTDIKIYELMYRLYGTDGMEKLVFGLISTRNVIGLKFALEHGADFLEYKASYYKCNALKYAEIEYKKYTDPDNPLKEIYNMLKSAAEKQ